MAGMRQKVNQYLNDTNDPKEEFLRLIDLFEKEGRSEELISYFVILRDVKLPQSIEQSRFSGEYTINHKPANKLLHIPRLYRRREDAEIELQRLIEIKLEQLRRKRNDNTSYYETRCPNYVEFRVKPLSIPKGFERHLGYEVAKDDYDTDESNKKEADFLKCYIKHLKKAWKTYSFRVLRTQMTFDEVLKHTTFQIKYDNAYLLISETFKYYETFLNSIGIYKINQYLDLMYEFSYNYIHKNGLGMFGFFGIDQAECSHQEHNKIVSFIHHLLVDSFRYDIKPESCLMGIQDVYERQVNDLIKRLHEEDLNDA